MRRESYIRKVYRSKYKELVVRGNDGVMIEMYRRKGVRGRHVGKAFGTKGKFWSIIIIMIFYRGKSVSTVTNCDRHNQAMREWRGEKFARKEWFEYLCGFIRYINSPFPSIPAFPSPEFTHQPILQDESWDRMTVSCPWDMWEWEMRETTDWRERWREYWQRTKHGLVVGWCSNIYPPVEGSCEWARVLRLISCLLLKWAWSWDRKRGRGIREKKCLVSCWRVCLFRWVRVTTINNHVQQWMKDSLQNYALRLGRECFVWRREDARTIDE